MPPKSHYLNRLRIVRQRRGLTQAQLATMAGLSRPFISELETGAKTPDFETLKTLADVLRVGMDDLYSDSPTSAKTRAID